MILISNAKCISGMILVCLKLKQNFDFTELGPTTKLNKINKK